MFHFLIFNSLENLETSMVFNAVVCLTSFGTDKLKLLNLHIYTVYFCAFSGIFAYLNYRSPLTREEIINILITGLKRLEYRGYDSAGMNAMLCSRFCEKLYSMTCEQM